MDTDLFALDVSLCGEADEILWDKGLHKLLEEYGSVHITGSYVLKVMAWRDLDIYLVAPDLSVDTFFELGNRIARLLRAVKMHYRDERIAKTPELPHDGLYWGVYAGDERTGAWKIDIWSVPPREYERLKVYIDAIAGRLTREARAKILSIKSQCWMKPGYRRRYSSRDIYRAVLDEGVSDIEEFGAYLQETEGCGIDD